MKYLGIALLLLLAACSKDPSNNGENNGGTNNGTNNGTANNGMPDMADNRDWGSGLTYHGDIEPLIQDNCMPCHSPGDIGPHDLTNPDTLISLAELVKASIQARTMPPWGVDNSGSCNTYQDARWLEDDEIATLVEWLDGDHAMGNPEWAPEPYEAPAPLPRVDFTVDTGVDYEPVNTPDDYRCFVVDPNLDSTKFITGFHVKPGNLEIVHHVVLFDLLSDENVAEVEALDAATPEPGYECFGGPGTAAFNLYGAWAPGTPPTIFPERTGLEIPAGRKFVVQMHYNSAVATGSDRTTVDFMAEDAVAFPTFQVLFADIFMALPGGSMAAETSLDIQPSQLGAPTTVTVHGVFPHMHEKGTKMSVTHISDEGAVCAVDVPAWDFNWQQLYFFDKPLELKPDDLLRLRCEYDVSQDAGMVPWGEGTGDEMCVAIFYTTLGPYADSVRPAESGDAVTVPVSDPDNSGVTKSWHKRLGGSQNDNAAQLLADGTHLWVAGQVTGGPVDWEGTNLPATSMEGLIAKYDLDGTLLWARSYQAPGPNQWNSIATDGQGGAFIGGNYTSEFTLEGTVHLADADTNAQAIVARVDADGNVVWSRSFGGDGDDWVSWRGSTADASGNLIVTGRLFGEVDVLGTTIGVADTLSAFVAKIDPDGNLVWANALCSSDTDCLATMPAAGPNDTIALVGLYRGTTQFDGEANPIVAAGAAEEGLVDRYDAFIMGLDADGNRQWLNTYGGELGDEFQGARFDANGDIYVGGWVTGAVDLGDGAMTFSGAPDALIAKFDGNGSLLWSQTVGGIGADRAFDVEVDAAGNPVLAVRYEAWGDFGGGLHVSEGRADAALVSFAPNGDFLWSKAFGGRSWEDRMRLAADASGLYLSFITWEDVLIDGDTPPGSGLADIVLVKFALP